MHIGKWSVANGLYIYINEMIGLQTTIDTNKNMLNNFFSSNKFLTSLLNMYTMYINIVWPLYEYSHFVIVLYVCCYLQNKLRITKVSNRGDNTKTKTEHLCVCVCVWVGGCGLKRNKQRHETHFTHSRNSCCLIFTYSILIVVDSYD